MFLSLCSLTFNIVLAFILLFDKVEGQGGGQNVVDLEIRPNKPTGDNGSKNNTQELGTGVSDERDEMDLCTGAAGPRLPNAVYSPGRTNFASVDDVNGGYCGVDINKPGIWWWIEGTGEIITMSTCHIQTTIKVKISVFSGDSCEELTCVTGGEERDYECPLLRKDNELGEWDTMATAVSFQSLLGQNYYILVHQADDSPGDVWLNFRHPLVPANDNCVDAIGPVPRDLTRISATSTDASKSFINPAVGFCNDALPSLYPGTWFQVIGTGEPLSVMACGLNNFDGYAFSVYDSDNGFCDSLECVSGSYKIGIEDPEKCTFGEVSRVMTKFTFDTVDRNRYYVYVHFARTAADYPTGDFRFYVDDGSDGNGSSSGAHEIIFSNDTSIVSGIPCFRVESSSDGIGGGNNDSVESSDGTLLLPGYIILRTLTIVGCALS